MVDEVSDWVQLRDAAAAIKRGTMMRLPDLLIKFEQNVTTAGGVMHWARDSAEANSIVTDLVRATGAREVVKLKPMATEEIGLNESLAEAGIRAHETDLAELIVQLGDDQPSHIVVPAIHRNRTQIRDLFLRELPGVDIGLSDDPRSSAIPARPLPRGACRDLRGELRGGGVGHGRGRRVRGQRADVPDAPRDAHHGRGGREARPELARSRNVPPGTGALSDRRADEPLHVNVDRSAPWRRTERLPPRPAR